MEARLEKPRDVVLKELDEMEFGSEGKPGLRQLWEQSRLTNPAGEQTSRLSEGLSDLRRQRRYLKMNLFHQVLTDLCSENGEVVLYRFQMFAWTLGLGVVFLMRVVSDLKMPDFPAQLLALMGLSAGTYLGFRIPEAQRLREGLVSPEAEIRRASEPGQMTRETETQAR